MGGLAILLQILTATNQATPLIVGLINMIKGGQASGKTDAEILDEAMAFAQDALKVSEQDMNPGP